MGGVDLSRNIMSSLLKDNPDEKAIRIATEKAALVLEQILKKENADLKAQ
jgi:uncharacterized protein YneF (UPF0154 family)